MNITIICDVLGEANNGTSLAAFNLIRHLKSKGHNVTVVAPDAPDEEGFVSVPSLDLTFMLNWALRLNDVVLAKPDKQLLADAIRDADVVHLLVPLPLSVAAVKIAKEMDKPVTASFHCQAENVTAHFGLMDFSLANNATYEAFYKLVYQYCDCVHYPTEMIRRIFERAVGHKTNAYVISNGVNDSFVPPSQPPHNDKFTIVCSGRYSREKAQQQLLKAVAISKHKDEIRVILAGDGPRGSYLKALANRFDIDATFAFFSRDQMVKNLQNADLYVHTAIIEIEAIACMEAICCGAVPVICNSPRSATRFFAIGDNSLYEQYDIEDLASKIDYWFEHPEEKAERSKEYGATRRSFSQRECMEKMEAMLTDAVRNK